MQIIYNEVELNIDNDYTAINTIFEKINDSIKRQNVVFSHLTVDGIEVYENHEEYLKDRIYDINTVEIVLRKTKVMIWETMTSVNDYLLRAIPALKKLADESYEKFTKETWKGIDQLADGMQLILQFVSFTKSSIQQPLHWDEIEKSFQACEENFVKLIEGVEIKDTVLISDILTYEVTPAYEELQKRLAASLKDEEFLRNVN
ncbi:hypothetical protein [Ornithinibacillus contaminans]|uniref:hypothetical protein n=1 Tax=Ornithinibacillus contaminans TaxID=694055 RepID=UPI00069F0517|nr:hypothetical protein [Ornithinibacillus contaminans]